MHSKLHVSLYNEILPLPSTECQQCKIKYVYNNDTQSKGILQGTCEKEEKRKSNNNNDNVNIRDSDEVDCAVFTTFELHSTSIKNYKHRQRQDISAAGNPC